MDYAIFAMDLSRTLTRWSRGAEEILGWSAGEALGQHADMIFTDEDRSNEVPEKEAATSLRDGRSLDERWHLRRDQTRFWASGEMMPLRAADGAAIGLVKIVRDRTGRWLAEQKHLTLAKLGEGLANMVEPLEMATLASSLVRDTLNASGACYATVGDALRIEGQSLAPHAHVRSSDLLAACRRCCSDGKWSDAPPGGSATVSADAGPTGAFCVVPLMEARRLVAVFAIIQEGERRWTAEEKDFIREIALRSRFAIERRRAEEALRILARDLEKQVDRRLAERNRLWASTRDLMAIVDSNGLLIEVNPAWQMSLGWTAEQLLGQSLFKLSDGAGVELLSRALRQHEQATFQLAIKSADQQWRRLEWSLSPDHEVGYLVGRDVTEQLAVEARLRQSQKMEAIGQLTGGLAHDFNNLLAGIIGSLDLLTLRIASNRPEDIERHIKAARTAAHRAAALTHRLLVFSRQQPLDPKPVDMNRLVAGMEELLRRTLPVRIDLEFNLHATRTIMSDEHQLENAVLNLVINARDAMPSKGKITISTDDSGPSRPVSGRATDALASSPFGCLSVQDNGEGIPEEVVSKVFEPFFTTKPAGQGTGLGLAMIYGFVKQMNGEVALETTRGSGTTLRLFFPRASGDENAPDSSAPTGGYPRGAGERVLVVEDDAIVRATIIELLSELGYAPEGADTPGAAMNALHSGVRFDLVVTDWGLPGLNGGALAQLARELRPTMPICFVTGYNSGDAEIGTLRPNETLLTKPVGIDVLARVVSDMLGRQNRS